MLPCVRIVLKDRLLVFFPQTLRFLPVYVQTAGDWGDYYRQGPIRPLWYASPRHLGVGPGK